MDGTLRPRLRPAFPVLLLVGCCIACSGCQQVDRVAAWVEGLFEEAPEEGGGRTPGPKAGGERPGTGDDVVVEGQTMPGFYTYTDARGTVHYVDSLTSVPKKYRDKARHPRSGAVSVLPASPVDKVLAKYGIDPKLFEPSNEEVAGAQAAGGEGDRPTPSRGVVIYSTPWCPACKHAKSHLQSRGVRFVEKNVEASRAAAEEMLRISGGSRGVPVLDIGGQIIKGFNAQAIDRALEQMKS